MTHVVPRTNVAFVLVCLLGLSAPSAAQQPPAKPPAAPANDLDAFMEKVLERRDFNRRTLEQYVLDEEEQFEVLGPGRMPLYRQKREFTWYVRDGLHVRSPVRFDGVSVGDEQRKRYEDGWAKRERGRLEAKNKKAKEAKEAKGENASDPPPSTDDPAGPAGASPIPTPRFVSEAYFMDFKFEPGNYYLAGREQLEGQTVLRIEYYPTRMFGDDDKKKEGRKAPDKEKESRQQRRARETGERIERQMNKTALVTLWVDPAEHQIVKYTFDNVWMDFLPAAWLVRVDDIRASMSMGQPFAGIWLPRDMNVHAGVTIASGSLEAAYARKFSDYKQAETKTLIRIPKDQLPEELPAPESDHFDRDESGPFVPERDPQAEVVAEIRVHGNAFIKDEEVIRLAGVALGQNVQPDTLRAIEQRLKSSGFFDTVEIRKRYRSLDSLSDVSIVLLVHEREGQTSELAIEPPSMWPWSIMRRMKSRLMFLPILGYNDGYGFTYGGRVSTVGLLGMGERLSVPLTWGGTRRAAVEFERTFRSGPLSRVASSFGISQSQNPRFELDDRRVAWTARAERSFAGIVRAGVDTSQSTVRFNPFDDRLWTLGADAALDTRGDPGFPRNAVYLGASWNGLHVRRLDGRINRYTTDARGYLGVIRQAVVAGRVEYSTSDRALPPYERLLLGGASTLRGFRAGAFDGDRRLVTSAELRVPITSVLSGAKLGLTAFVDASKTFDVGQSAKDAAWHRGVGGGVFMIATIVRINLDVARGLEDGDTRVHLSSGFSF